MRRHNPLLLEIPMQVIVKIKDLTPGDVSVNEALDIQAEEMQLLARSLVGELDFPGGTWLVIVDLSVVASRVLPKLE